jgi:hypothetical protein
LERMKALSLSISLEKLWGIGTLAMTLTGDL